MPRPPRAFNPGLHHVAPRASDSRYLFEQDSERVSFLPELARQLDRLEVGLVAYTLMGTHYHAIVKIPDGRLAIALQRLHTWYARMVNKKRGRQAHLFRAHYFAREITSDEDLLAVCHYLAHNPVAAGLAPDPFSWPWTSVSPTAGLAPAPVALDLEPVRAAFGEYRGWQAQYKAFIAQPKRR